MVNAFADYNGGNVSTEGGIIVNIQFTDDIAGIAREKEIEGLIDHLYKNNKAYNMEIRPNAMTNNQTNPIMISEFWKRKDFRIRRIHCV